MKLHFEPDLDFQLEAIEAVCDLFRGQEINRSEFALGRPWRPMPDSRGQEPLNFGAFAGEQGELGITENELGVGNRLTLPDEKILENLQAVQLRSGLPPSDALNSGDFTVEMETGTGKTYVYLRSIFELHKRCGFTKFVIVVPSVAIKEGVYKTLQITEDHFRRLYAGAPFGYFIYDSAKLGQVRNFAVSSQIQIMVVTVGAINKQAVNNLYKDSEKTGGEAPIDLIRATRPILIVDEPQSVDGGLQGRGREALGRMNPLCALRYSATHADQHHMIYRLDAVDAYERKLVKQIEVASAAVEDAYNKPYVRLVSTIGRRGVISAKVEIDVETPGGVRRRVVSVQDGDDLEQKTKRVIYCDHRIGEIRVGRGNEFLELRVPGDDRFLRPGEAWGDVDRLAVQREMIRRTIREHLDKEKRLRPQGIKVLSLFFIDAVDRYRRYDDEGNPVKGDYARIFEEEYRRLAGHPDYRALFEGADMETIAEEAHDGYFSIDKKGGWTDTAENNQTGRDSAERAYNLIMRDKEKLLSLETPLKFIFSHSALREGWDNPNVFQICALRDISTERERRQTIGRGLRLCVNQEGRRLHGFELNTLTVIARESYEEFAENLQSEIESETGVRFGIVEKHQFAAIPVIDEEGRRETLGVEKSKILWERLRAKGYIDAKGRIQDSLRVALQEEAFSAPEAFREQRGEIVSILRKLAGRLNIRNADERRAVRPRQAVLHSPEFKALWDRVKHKTIYRVAFDNDKLLEDCASALRDMPTIPKTRLQWRKAEVAIGQSGVEATEKSVASPVSLDESQVELPDLLSQLQDRTQLTRRSVWRILCESRRLGDFKGNPQEFVEVAAREINLRKRLALVSGVKYERIGDEHYYAQELFETEELTGYLKNMLAAQKSVYEQVVYESGVEARFAEELERYEAIKVYAKLPGWFQVPTPLGGYRPDWAVLIDAEEGERLYLVVETKASTSEDSLRPLEIDKMTCGEAHFEALAVGENPARYKKAAALDELMAQL